MNADNRLMFRLSTVKKEAFLKKVQQEGKKASEVLVKLVDSYLESEQSQLDCSSIESIKTLVERHEHEIELLKREMLGESHA